MSGPDSKNSLFKRLLLTALLFGPLAVVRPQTARAQADTAYFHGTIREWEESMWLTLLDRNGAAGGRFSEDGILQRFQDEIDHEYHLDVFTHRFGLAEDFEWYERSSGLRWGGGSINKRTLAANAQLRTTVSVAEKWRVAALFDFQTAAEASRNVLRLGIGREVGRGIEVGAVGQLDYVKSGMDLGFGVNWRRPESWLQRAAVSVTVLDLFNDEFNGLDGNVDSTQDYDRLPLALRSGAGVRISPRVRAEAFGTVMLPTTIARYHSTDATAGFRQREAFGYAGGLVEWAPLRTLRVGAMARYVRAGTERRPLAGGVDIDPFDLVEESAAAGGFALWRFWNRVTAEVEVNRVWRTERRTSSSPDVPEVDYHDRAWTGRSLLLWEIPFGLVIQGGVAFDERRVARGAGTLPGYGDPEFSNWRGQVGFGWTFAGRFTFRVAQRFDFESDFLGDGGVAHAYLYW